jgi:signal transduction histidine kinase/sensor domain CHASE-containing protein
MRWAALLVIALLILMSELTIWQAIRIHEVEIQEYLANRGSEARAKLESELNAALHLTIGMTSYIQSQEGQFQPERLTTWISNLIQNSRHVRNIGIAPNNRIQYIFPLQGNEAALGLYYPDLKDQWSAVEKMIQDRKPTLAGPITLKQGGRGFVYRVPIFIQDHYWGLVSTVFDADSLLTVMQSYNTKPEEGLTLATRDAEDPVQYRNFWGRVPRHEDLRHDMQLNLPNVQWRLTISRQPDAHTPWLMRGSAWLLIFLGVLGYARWQRQQASKKQADQAIRAEQAFNSAILERVMEGVLTLDEKGGFVSSNQAACELLGLDEIRPGMQLQEVLDLTSAAPTRRDDHETQPNAPSNWLQSLSGQLQRAKLKNSPHAGRDLEVMTAPLIDVPEARWLVLLRDISERLRNDRMKNEFVSTVSHELRTPLTSISGALSLLSNEVLGVMPEKALSLIKMADQNARRLTLLINDLLDMEKLLAGQMQMHPQPCDLIPLLEQSIRDNRGYADQFKVTLQLQSEPSVAAAPIHVWLDPSRLQQVLANLLSNAIKFSPPHESVTLRLERQAAIVRICVIDHGLGIPTEFHERLFQKFTQADSSDSRQKGGTGLGLAISKELVERMGGTIGFSTKVQEGTCFFVEFPIFEKQAE